MNRDPLGRIGTIALVLALCQHAARAAEYTYCGPVATVNEGWFHDTGNWSPAGGPPGSADVAVFDEDNWFNVYLAQPVITNKQLKISAGDVSFMMGVPTLLPCHDPAIYHLEGAGTFIRVAAVIGNKPGPRTTLRVHGSLPAHCLRPGFVNADGMLIIGQNEDSSGRLMFGRTGTTTGPTTWTSTYPTWVGSAGDGELVIPVTHTMINSSAVLGSAYGSRGQAVVDGTWTNNGLLKIGAGGHGTLSVRGEVFSSGDCYIGEDPGSVGEVFVDWSASLPGDWITEGTLCVGGDDSGPGGSGSITVDGGHVDVHEHTKVWSAGTIIQNQGSVTLGHTQIRHGGEITVTDGVFIADDLEVFAGGLFELTGGSAACDSVNCAGTLDLTGGTLYVHGDLRQATGFAINLSDDATLNVDALTGYQADWNWTGGTLNVTDDHLRIDDGQPLGPDVEIGPGQTLTVADALFVGPDTYGSLSVLQGGSVVSDYAEIGGPSSGGSALLSGDGTLWTVHHALVVGGADGSQLTAQTGAGLATNGALIAYEADMNAAIALHGAGTEWRSTGPFLAGGDETTSGGAGTVEIGDGAILTVDSSMTVWDDFTVTILGDDSRLVADDLTIIGGVAATDEGLVDLSGGSLSIEQGGMLNAPIIGNATTSVALHDAGSSWSVPGSLQIGVDTAGVGHVHALSLAPGTVVAVEDTATVANMFALTLGGGTISANMIDIIDPNFSDFGTLHGHVVAAGSLAAAGDLVVGDMERAGAVEIAGAVTVGPHHVTLQQLGRLFLTGATSIAGGTLTVPHSLGLTASDSIVGFGVLETPNDPVAAIINNGEIIGTSQTEPIELTGYITGVGTLANVTIFGTDAPGFAAPAHVERGSVTYAGTVAIELGGLTAGSEHDDIHHATGIPHFGGTLVVELIDGFEPAAGDLFTILTYPSRVGTFDVHALPALPRDLVWDIHYGPCALTLGVVGPIPGDCNGDSTVDLTDHSALTACLIGPGQSTTPACGCYDVNDSGAVDLADFAVFQTAFTGS